MSITKITAAAAIALALGFSSTAQAGGMNTGYVDHVTAETNPLVFGVEFQPTGEKSVTMEYDRVTTETRPDVFGSYKPQGWEETGADDLSAMLSQGS
tara:strand:+ start:10444 stop:10734 length:291 start_codon:yes stop_codon:yes gene_type:complete